MSTDIQAKDTGAIAEQVLIGGDLAKLSAGQRADYYLKVCESIGVNPYTKPFDFITLNGKLTLYAKRDCTDQLRRINGVSCTITAREKLEDLYIVTAKARDKDQREDESTGVVSLLGLKGEALANALMKAETKSKRRVTLSICGLGWLDESEVDSVPDARRVNVDTTTGEIIDAEPTTPAVDLISAQWSRKIHAMAREAFGDGDDARERFRALKQQLCGHTNKTTELTREEGEALTDALQVLIDERGDADAVALNQDSGIFVTDAR